MSNVLGWLPSNNGTVTLTSTGPCLTGDGATADPNAYSTPLVPVTPGVEYEITAALYSPQGWSAVSVFAAFFGTDSAYQSGVYPAGTNLPASEITPGSLTFTVPDTGVYAQVLFQLHGTPASSVQLFFGNVTLGSVPEPEDTFAINGNLVDGQGLITLPDRYDFVQVASDDTNGLFVTTDGSPATIDGDDVDYVAPGEASLFNNRAGWWFQGSPGWDGTMDNPGTTIRLSSTSDTASYSVSAA